MCEVPLQSSFSPHMQERAPGSSCPHLFTFAKSCNFNASAKTAGQSCGCLAWCGALRSVHTRPSPRPVRRGFRRGAASSLWRALRARLVGAHASTAVPCDSDNGAASRPTRAGRRVAIHFTGAGRMAAALNEQLPCGLLQWQVLELLDRDITPNDYEMLLQLDENLARSTLSAKDVCSLPVAPSWSLLGESCAICQLAFSEKDDAKVLRCEHLFHDECISRWLLERSCSCPLCGMDVVLA